LSYGCSSEVGDQNFGSLSTNYGDGFVAIGQSAEEFVGGSGVGIVDLGQDSYAGEASPVEVAKACSVAGAGYGVSGLQAHGL
jgi:hypothetical protein